MRCPNCGYISFDHLDTCLKCKKKIKKDADSLHGTVYNAEPPSFLKYSPPEPEEETSDFDDIFNETELEDTRLDPDLDILLDADDTDGTEQEEAVPTIALDTANSDEEFSFDEDAEEEAAFDFNQLEDGDLEADGDTDFSMEIPEELQDMSDLEPQEEEFGELDLSDEGQSVEEDIANFDIDESLFEGSDDIDDFDMNLDIGDLSDELTLDDSETEVQVEATPTEEPDIPNLSLDMDDDISELSLDETAKDSDSINMDEDLDFELDLGGLSLDDK